MRNDRWAPIDDTPILSLTYRFGGGLANAIAVPYAEGYAVVSPPAGVSEAAYADLEQRGPVRALVAPNAYHTLGVRPWKERFADAAVFAPEQSRARVAKHSKVAGIEPLAKMKSDRAGVELVDMPHFKSGEVLVRVNAGDRVIWYFTDLVMNLPKLPPSFPMRQVFGWTKSAPGLRPNWLATTFMVKDKAPLFRWLRSEVEKAPPTTILSAHGDHVFDRAAERLLACLPS